MEKALSKRQQKIQNILTAQGSMENEGVIGYVFLYLFIYLVSSFGIKKLSSWAFSLNIDPTNPHFVAIYRSIIIIAIISVILSLYLAAFLVLNVFFKKHRRIFNEIEYKKFRIYSFLIFVVISLSMYVWHIYEFMQLFPPNASPSGEPADLLLMAIFVALGIILGLGIMRAVMQRTFDSVLLMLFK